MFKVSAVGFETHTKNRDVDQLLDQWSSASRWPRFNQMQL